MELTFRSAQSSCRNRNHFTGLSVLKSFYEVFPPMSGRKAEGGRQKEEVLLPCKPIENNRPTTMLTQPGQEQPPLVTEEGMIASHTGKPGVNELKQQSTQETAGIMQLQISC